MFRDLFVYQHEFFASLYVNPSTMDVRYKPPANVRRIDYLLVKDMIKLGRIKPYDERTVEALYAILTEPDQRTFMFRQPYEAHIKKGDSFEIMRNKKRTAKFLINRLDKLLERRDIDNHKLENFIGIFKEYIE